MHPNKKINIERKETREYNNFFLFFLVSGCVKVVVWLPPVSASEEMFALLSQFGHKWCAVSDVRRFMPLVRGDTGLLDRLKGLVELSERGTPPDVSGMKHTYESVQLCSIN